MKILAIRVGGSGNASDTAGLFIDGGHVPPSCEGHVLRRGTLNLVLQTGTSFQTPSDGSAGHTFVFRDEPYYIQRIDLKVIRGGKKASESVPGFILRNRSHPSEFDNIIEVIAPDLAAFLHPRLKEWFELDGPFEVQSGGANHV